MNIEIYGNKVRVEVTEVQAMNMVLDLVAQLKRKAEFGHSLTVSIPATMSVGLDRAVAGVMHIQVG